MKKLFVFATMIAGASLTTDAQTILPYSNGFDTQSEMDDWTVYREGLTTINGVASHTWEPAPSPGAATAPNMAFHDYPVGYSGTELTDDWLVLKSLDFSAGGRLSMKLWIYAIQSLSPGDTVQLYLFSGSPDPALATKTLIADLTYLTTNVGYPNAPEWKDTADIIIPPIPTGAYIAFRYTCIQNWFTIAMDNIEITSDSMPPSGIKDVSGGISNLNIYPNPATEMLYWTYLSKTPLHTDQGRLMDISGKILATFSAKEKQLNIQSLNAGLYFLKIGDAIQSFIKK